MLQCQEDTDEFVTINLEADSCDLCYRDNGQEVTQCKICQSLLTDGPIRFGFNDIRGVIHTNKLGHDRCFKEDHYQLLERSINEESPSGRINPVSPHRLKTPPRHIHASSLPKPTHLSVEWTNNIQNNAIKSHSNPSTRSSSPIHIGRRGSTPFSDHQHLELRKNCARYLFGEKSPEFEQYSNQIVPFINYKEDHFSVKDGRDEKSSLSIDLNSIPQLLKSGGLLNLPVVPFDTYNTAWEKKNRKGSPLSRFQANISFYGGKKISGDRCNKLTQTGETFQPPGIPERKQMTMSPYTKSELKNLGLDLLREIIDSLQHIVTETSTDLVSLLEERDNLKHENDTRHVTIQKLVQLQTEKINSSPNMPRNK